MNLRTMKKIYLVNVSETYLGIGAIAVKATSPYYFRFGIFLPFGVVQTIGNFARVMSLVVGHAKSWDIGGPVLGVPALPPSTPKMPSVVMDLPILSPLKTHNQFNGIFLDLLASARPKAKLEGHSVERMYLRQSCSHGSQ